MVVVNDPIYLTEPFMRTTDFNLNLQQDIAPYPCEAVMEVDRPLGMVPHHLPGTNTFLTEFADKHKLPAQAYAGRVGDDVSGVPHEDRGDGGCEVR